MKMVLSKVLFRWLKTPRNDITKLFSSSSISHAVLYRPMTSIQESLPTNKYATIVGTLVWYWIIYHCLTQYEHVTGEWNRPDPSKWSNEELGIPKNEEELE